MVKNVLKKNEKRRKNNKGFSLVELIVVIAIMAVLVGILAPQLIKYVEKSREATDIQNCDSIATTVKSYYADVEDADTVVVTVTKSGTTVTVGGTADSAKKCLAGSGLDNTKLKGSGWTAAGIQITYTGSTGKVTYALSSDYYTNNSDGEITKNN